MDVKEFGYLHLIGSFLFRLVLVGFSPQYYLLLLEIAPLLFVDEHQIEIVLARELLLYVSHRRREVVGAEEQANRYALAFHGRAVHYLVLGNRFGLVLCVVTDYLAFYDRQLHVFHFDTDQQEIDLSDYHVSQMISFFFFFD